MPAVYVHSSVVTMISRIVILEDVDVTRSRTYGHTHDWRAEDTVVSAISVHPFSFLRIRAHPFGSDRLQP